MLINRAFSLGVITFWNQSREVFWIFNLHQVENCLEVNLFTGLVPRSVFRFENTAFWILKFSPYVTYTTPRMPMSFVMLICSYANQRWNWCQSRPQVTRLPRRHQYNCWLGVRWTVSVEPWIGHRWFWESGTGFSQWIYIQIAARERNCFDVGWRWHQRTDSHSTAVGLGGVYKAANCEIVWLDRRHKYRRYTGTCGCSWWVTHEGA